MEITDAIAKNSCDVSSWSKLLLLPHHCFKTPTRGGIKNNSAKFMQRNIQSFKQSSLPQLLNIEPCNTPRPSHSNLSAEKRIKLVCNKIEEGNIRSATRLLVDDVSVASPSDDTLNELIKKHPPEQNNFNYHVQDCPPFLSARKTFPKLCNLSQTALPAVSTASLLNI